MKKIIYLLLLPLLMSSCFKESMTERLNSIDSLVVSELYDSAYASIMKLDRMELITREDSAHYHLLLTQTSILSSLSDTLVTLDSIVIPYYNKVENHEKLAEAYYYSAYIKVLEGDIPNAIMWYKKAEEMAKNSTNHRLQYKIAESLSYVNEVSGNYLLQLSYTKKTLNIARTINNKEWEAYAYLRIALAQSELKHKDSAIAYLNKMIPLIGYVKKEDRPTFLVNAAYTLKHTSPDSAKYFLKEALAKEESSITMQHLADIYKYEGNLDEAYRLWIKALSVNDGIPKDIILQNILQYDMDHGKTENICKTVDKIIHIKDSMLNSLRNDTIKDLQLRFDKEVALRQQEQITGKWQKGVLATVIIVVLLYAYIIINRMLEKMKMKEAQMQINHYMNQIRNLEASGKESEEEIAKLNKQMKDYLGKKAPNLLKGCLYYEQIKENQISQLLKDGWYKKEEQLFIDYYEAIDYGTVNRLRKTKRREELTTHQLCFLLLLEMGKSENEIAALFNIKERSIDTLITRTKAIE